MEEMTQMLDVLKGAWPSIQPAISTMFGTVVARLFLRGNISKSEIEKIKQTKFSEIADKLLEDGYITHLEYYKCHNFNKIAQKADNVYKQQHAALSANIVDEKEKTFSIDWFIRFFEDAGNISDEQMQELWAKALAGEIMQPGSFSLRTLDFLKNLSKVEAETLQLLASYAIQIGNRYYISVDADLKSQYDYGTKLLTAYDCGIIENNIAYHHTLTTNSEGTLIKTGSLVCYSHNEGAEEYFLDMQRFTTTGNELIRLVSPNKKYLLDFFRGMKRNFPKLNLTVHTIVKDNGDTFDYITTSLI